MFFHDSRGHLLCRSRLCSAWHCPDFKCMSCCKQHSVLSWLYESYILFLFLIPKFPSFFGGYFIGINQSFMMGMHSSLVAGVRLESLITYRWHLVFIFCWECVFFGGCGEVVPSVMMDLTFCVLLLSGFNITAWVFAVDYSSGILPHGQWLVFLHEFIKY